LQPEVFTLAVISVFMHYPEEVVRKVTDPFDGIAGRLKWPPTIEEVKAACQAEVRGFVDEWGARSRRQLRERKEIEEHVAPTQGYDDFRAEMATRGLPIGGKRYVSRETREEVMAKLRISQAEWDALPDAPEPGAWEKLAGNFR
jgi:hypothetical protein